MSGPGDVEWAWPNKTTMSGCVGERDRKTGGDVREMTEHGWWRGWRDCAKTGKNKPVAAPPSQLTARNSDDQDGSEKRGGTGEVGRKVPVRTGEN